MDFVCAKCGEEVKMKEGLICRGCLCPKDTGVLANLSGHVVGVGSMIDPDEE